MDNIYTVLKFLTVVLGFIVAAFNAYHKWLDVQEKRSKIAAEDANRREAEARAKAAEDLASATPYLSTALSLGGAVAGLLLGPVGVAFGLPAVSAAIALAARQESSEKNKSE